MSLLATAARRRPRRTADVADQAAADQAAAYQAVLDGADRRRTAAPVPHAAEPFLDAEFRAQCEAALAAPDGTGLFADPATADDIRFSIEVLLADDDRARAGDHAATEAGPVLPGAAVTRSDLYLWVAAKLADLAEAEADPAAGITLGAVTTRPTAALDHAVRFVVWALLLCPVIAWVHGDIGFTVFVVAASGVFLTFQLIVQALTALVRGTALVVSRKELGLRIVVATVLAGLLSTASLAHWQVLVTTAVVVLVTDRLLGLVRPRAAR